MTEHALSADLRRTATQLDALAFPQTSPNAKRLRLLADELDAMQTALAELQERVALLEAVISKVHDGTKDAWAKDRLGDVLPEDGRDEPDVD